jgi:F420-0:gamma-glutamyl ligase
MKVTAIQTKLYKREMDLIEFVANSVPPEMIQEEMILAVTSKLASVAENRFVSRDVDKKELVRKEADIFIGEVGYGSQLTVKHNHLILSAGIDESNSQSGDYLLYPENPFASVQALRAGLRQKWNLEHLGVMLTDSRTIPLRKGVTGFCLSYAGFQGVINKVGEQDLFGRELKMTQINVADALGAAAVLTMGEAAEQKPIAVINEIDVTFTNSNSRSEIEVPVEDDLYLQTLWKFCKTL